MQILLAIIPLSAFISIFIFLYNKRPSNSARRVLIHSALWFTAYLVVWLEILSIFRWVTQVGLVVIWILPIAFLLVWLWWKKKANQPIDLLHIHFPSTWWNRSLLLLISGVLLITGLVAWITPPQTWDSLTYHLSRVAHWAEARSVWHYATGIDRQTSMPPGAEELVLNLYVLTQGDRLASFPQWFSMLGCLIGVSLVAYYLGAKSDGQWIAAGFAATIPMGIVEASSTITDYVTTFWVVCVVVECIAYYRHDENRSLIYISMATGLAIFTKPTSVPFILPFGFWLVYLLVKRHGFLASFKWAGAALVIFGIINSGYLIRNYLTYGALSNPIDFENHYNQLHSIQGFITTLLKNIGMHVGLPHLEGVNQAWYGLILKIVVKLGLDINDPRITSVGYFHVSAPMTDEDFASNPYHAYLIFILFVMMFFLIKKHAKPFVLYGMLAASTICLFSFIFKWNAFGTRYDLAFFVLFAPLAGVILGGFAKYKPGYILTCLLLVGSFPWLFSIVSRPLIANPRLEPGKLSILQSSRQSLYFANAPAEMDPYIEFTNTIKSANCKEIGIMLRGDDPEYLIWALMGAPYSSLNIQWIVTGPTDKYSQTDFKPCAIICRGCTQDQTPIRGLVIARQHSDIWLYLPPEP